MPEDNVTKVRNYHSALHLRCGFIAEVKLSGLRFYSGAQVSVLHSTAVTPSGALAVLQGHLSAVSIKSNVLSF